MATASLRFLLEACKGVQQQLLLLLLLAVTRLELCAKKIKEGNLQRKMTLEK